MENCSLATLQVSEANAEAIITLTQRFIFKYFVLKLESIKWQLQLIAFIHQFHKFYLCKDPLNVVQNIHINIDLFYSVSVLPSAPKELKNIEHNMDSFEI